MAFFDWNETLSVKIKTIDDQHKRLIDLINDFYDCINNRSNNESISRLINGMKNYAMMHFVKEESLMKQYKYNDYELHKKEHDEFIMKVVDFEEKFNSNRLIVSLEITRFLKDWIKKHIQGTDMLYSDFFIKKGVR